jgi:hypothetical protein
MRARACVSEKIKTLKKFSVSLCVCVCVCGLENEEEDGSEKKKLNWMMCSAKCVEGCIERLPSVLVAYVCGFLGLEDHGVFARLSRTIAAAVAHGLQWASPYRVSVSDMYAIMPERALKWHIRVLCLPDHVLVSAQATLLQNSAARQSLHTLDFSLPPVYMRQFDTSWMQTITEFPNLRVLRIRSVQNTADHHNLLRVAGNANRGARPPLSVTEPRGISLDVWCETTLPVALVCELPLRKLHLQFIKEDALYTLLCRSHALASLHVGRVHITRKGANSARLLLENPDIHVVVGLTSLTIESRLRRSALWTILATCSALRDLDVTCARKVRHQLGLTQLKQLESLRLVVPDVVSFVAPMLTANTYDIRLFPKLRRLTLRNHDIDPQEETPDEGTARSGLDDTYNENGSRLSLTLLFGLTTLTHLDVSDIFFAPLDATDEKDVPLDATDEKDVPLDATDEKDVPLDATDEKDVPLVATHSRCLEHLVYLAITYDSESTNEGPISTVTNTDVDVASMFPNLEELRVNVEALDFDDPFGIGWCRKLHILNLQLDDELVPKKYKHMLRKDTICCPDLRLVRVTRPLSPALERWTRAQGLDVATLSCE